MCDLIVLAGAPGSGKTTTMRLLQPILCSPAIDLGHLRAFHLDAAWTNATPQEEQMSFENLIALVTNYLRYGYKNIMITDLEDERVQKIPVLFAKHNYLIATLLVREDDQLATRVCTPTRDSGFRDVARALAWNQSIQQRPLLSNEYRIDTTDQQPEQTAAEILRLIHRYGC
jgi:broad-specificity NMP kinase